MKKAFLILVIVSITGILQAQNEIITKGITLKETNDDSFVHKAFGDEIELSISTEDITRIKMETGAGKVKLRPSEDDQFSIHAEVVVAANNVKSAYAIIDKYLNLGVSRNNNELLLHSLFEYDDNDGDLRETLGFLKVPERKINIAVSVPNNIDIRINDRSGGLVIADLINNLDVTDGSGHLRIENIIGNLKLEDASGSINVSKVNFGETGDYQIYIKDHSGGISVNKITGNTTIDDSSGGMHVDKVIGDLVIHDSSGEVDVSHVSGILTIKDTSGAIVATNIKGSIRVSDTSGGIYINEVTEDVTVKNDGSGGVTVQNIGGKLRR